jgi:uncharacterized membrane protein YphA (DoxX/SURF4 family)
MIRTIINDNLITLFARCVVGVVFIVASADKIADPAVFARSIENYRIVSHSAAMVVATFLPWTELISGLFLVFGIFRHGAGLVTSGLLILFIIVVISAILRGLDISCGCFTQDPSAAKVGWWRVAEDCGLLALSLVAVLSENTVLSVEKILSNRRT